MKTLEYAGIRLIGSSVSHLLPWFLKPLSYEPLCYQSATMTSLATSVRLFDFMQCCVHWSTRWRYSNARENREPFSLYAFKSLSQYLRDANYNINFKCYISLRVLSLCLSLVTVKTLFCDMSQSAQTFFWNRPSSKEGAFCFVIQNYSQFLQCEHNKNEYFCQMIVEQKVVLVFRPFLSTFHGPRELTLHDFRSEVSVILHHKKRKSNLKCSHRNHFLIPNSLRSL